jgi:hypothetical protein
MADSSFTPAELAAHRAFIAECQASIEQLRTQLALLETGSSGNAGPETGYRWVDTTERDKDRVRTAIAEAAAAIFEFRNKTGYAGA